jgi:hypothetical protein
MTKTLWRETILLWLFTFVKIPLVFWLRPRILAISGLHAVVMMRFRRRTRNHVNSMYFGVLCAGGELAAGALTMNLLRKQKDKYSFIFKDFYAEFLKRCEANVHFTCNEGQVIAETIEKARQTKERQNVTLNVTGTVPAEYGDEPVCKFKLTLSIKLFLPNVQGA